MGSIMRAGNIQYYVHETASLRLMISLQSRVSKKRASLIPCTIINWPESHFESLEVISKKFAPRDDVWSPAFLEGGSGSLLRGQTNKVCLPAVIVRTPQSTRLIIDKWELVFASTEANKHVPNGPYAMSSESRDVFAVSRFFDDTHSAFIGGSVKRIGDSFEWLDIGVSLNHFRPVI